MAAVTSYATLICGYAAGKGSLSNRVGCECTQRQGWGIPFSLAQG